MYFDTIIVVLVTMFATLAAAECGLTLKKSVAPFKLLFRGVAKLFNNSNKEDKEDAKDEERERAKPEGL